MWDLQETTNITRTKIMSIMISTVAADVPVLWAPGHPLLQCWQNYEYESLQLIKLFKAGLFELIIMVILETTPGHHQPHCSRYHQHMLTAAVHRDNGVITDITQKTPIRTPTRNYV